MKKTFLLTIALLVLPMAALAQNASVGGTVTDPTGALIPGVDVTATNVNTGIVTGAITNETGTYSFQSLQPGTYEFSASLPGFQTATVTDVRLGQAQQARFNFELEVGAVATAVEVTADADLVLATTSSSVGDALPELEVTALPLASRNIMDLVATAAGASENFFGGQRRTSTNMTRDGLPVVNTRYQAFTDVTNITTYTSPDLVEEVQVIVGSVDAASGRGSGQVRLQTRSGTNEFHGALFYTNKNSALGAFNYFEKLGRTNPAKSFQNRNQYGGRLGGPIYRNKAFFFVLYEGQRFVEREQYVGTVLTDQARQGIFRYFGGRDNGNFFDPDSSRSVDLNGTPRTDIGTLQEFNVFTDVGDPNRTGINQTYIAELLRRMPPANDFTEGDGLNTAGHRFVRRIAGAGGNRNLSGGAANAVVGEDVNRDQINIRLDYQAGDNNKLTFTMTREDSRGHTVQSGIRQWPEGFDGDTNFFPYTYTAAWVSTISPTVLNEFRWGTQSSSFHQRSAFNLGCCFGEASDDFDETSQMVRDIFPSSNSYPTIVTSQLLGQPIAVHSFGSDRGADNPLWRFADSLSFTRGSHSFQTGIETIQQWTEGWNQTSRQYPELRLGEGNQNVVGINSTNFPGLQGGDATTRKSC